MPFQRMPRFDQTQNNSALSPETPLSELHAQWRDQQGIIDEQRRLLYEQNIWLEEQCALLDQQSTWHKQHHLGLEQQSSFLEAQRVLLDQQHIWLEEQCTLIDQSQSLLDKQKSQRIQE